MGKRGRKAKSLEVITSNTVIEKVTAIYPPEHDAKAEDVKTEDLKTEDAKEFENVLAIAPWEKIDLSKCSREEITSILMPRFGMDKDKMPSLVNALQNVLSLPERVTMATFSLSQREKMELRKQETAIALDKEVKPLYSRYADTFVALFQEFGFTSDGKAKKSFSLSNAYGHRIGKEQYKLSFSFQIAKEDVPLTQNELDELAYQASCIAQEAEWEKQRLLMVGNSIKEDRKPYPSVETIPTIVQDVSHKTIVQGLNSIKAEAISAA